MRTPSFGREDPEARQIRRVSADMRMTPARLTSIARRATSFGRRRMNDWRLRLECDVLVPTERLGSDYGGWRVLPGPLTSASVIYCFGVGEDISFDTALIDRFDAHVHAFDPTPRAIAWVQERAPAGFTMHAFGLADFDGEATFSPPSRTGDVSHSIAAGTSSNGPQFPVRRLATIMRDLDHDHIDLLKMDIEGAEYAVIDDLCRGTVRPQQLLVEFHHRFANIGLEPTRRAVDRLRSVGYELVAISPTKEELSFAYLR
jgi:FkbM family methyltransferase